MDAEEDNAARRRLPPKPPFVRLPKPFPIAAEDERIAARRRWRRPRRAPFGACTNSVPFGSCTNSQYGTSASCWLSSSQ